MGGFFKQKDRTPSGITSSSGNIIPSKNTVSSESNTKMYEYGVGRLKVFVDPSKGGEMVRAEVDGRKLINRYWMHSSPEGAADGSNYGYEMSRSDSTSVTLETHDELIVAGRLCQSNGSGNFFGHRYRRSYKFYPWGFDCENDMWISPEDVAEAKRKGMFSMWNGRPPLFYVWANPLDVFREFNHWNCGWDGCWDTYDYKKYLKNYKWGAVKQPEPGKHNNRGCTAMPENFGRNQFFMTMFKPSDIGIKRTVTKVITGSIDQVNIWSNTPNDVSHTCEISHVGGDRCNIDRQHRFLTPFVEESIKTAPRDQQRISFPRVRSTVTRFKERFEIGSVDGAGNIIRLIG